MNKEKLKEIAEGEWQEDHYCMMSFTGDYWQKFYGLSFLCFFPRYHTVHVSPIQYNLN